MTETDWMTPEECGRYLRVSVGTLYNWRAAGIGPPAAKLGGTKQSPLRYSRAAVDAWIDRGATDHGPVIAGDGVLCRTCGRSWPHPTEGDDE